MVLCSGKKKKKKKKNEPDRDEGSVTCFGKKKKDKKNAAICSGLLEETEGLIKELRQEVTDLRHAQAGRHDETRMLDESLRRLMEDKEKLLEERLRAREELAEMKLKHSIEEQRAIRLAAENSDLSRELGERCDDLNASIESARADQKQAADLTESLKRDCRQLKTSLKEAEHKLKQTAAKLAHAQDRCKSSKAEVDRLTTELSSLEINKVMTENELIYKLGALKKKYNNVKTLCRGKDVLINSLREDRSKALIQLWHATFGQKSLPPSVAILSPRKQLPQATVEPFQNDVITMCARSSPVQVQGNLGDFGCLSPELPQNKTVPMEFELFSKRNMAETMQDVHLPLSDVTDDSIHLHLGDFGRISPEFIQNETMSMEFEMFRKRKMAETMQDVRLPIARTKGEGNDVTDDSSSGVSEYANTTLKQRIVNGHFGDCGRISPEFPQNKTMSMEFEQFRQRKMAELMEDVSLPPSEGNDVTDDSSNGVSDYANTSLDSVVENQRKALSTASNISSAVSSETIL